MSPSVGEVSVITVSDKQITSSCCQKCNWYRAPNFEQVLLASTPLGASFFPEMTCFALVTTFLTQNFKMPKLDSAQRRATQSTDYVPPKALRQRRRPLPHKKNSCIFIFLFMLTKTGVHKDKWCFYAKK